MGNSEMTTTIEEVKRVAIECGISADFRYEQAEELRAFAQHWIEVGEKRQRKCASCGGNDGDAPCAYPGKHERQPGCLLAIRNNTGE